MELLRQAGRQSDQAGNDQGTPHPDDDRRHPELGRPWGSPHTAARPAGGSGIVGSMRPIERDEPGRHRRCGVVRLGVRPETGRIEPGAAVERAPDGAGQRFGRRCLGDLAVGSVPTEDLVDPARGHRGDREAAGERLDGHDAERLAGARMDEQRRALHGGGDAWPIGRRLEPDGRLEAELARPGAQPVVLAHGPPDESKAERRAIRAGEGERDQEHVGPLAGLSRADPQELVRVAPLGPDRPERGDVDRVGDHLDVVDRQAEQTGELTGEDGAHGDHSSTGDEQGAIGGPGPLGREPGRETALVLGHDERDAQPIGQHRGRRPVREPGVSMDEIDTAKVLASARPNGTRLRVWSAATSSGSGRPASPVGRRPGSGRPGCRARPTFGVDPVPRSLRGSRPSTRRSGRRRRAAPRGPR